MQVSSWLDSLWTSASVLWNKESGPHTWVEDDRLPIWTFTLTDLPGASRLLTGAILSDSKTCNHWSTASYGLFAPNLWYWIHVMMVMLLACALAIPTAVLTYYCIVRPQRTVQTHGTRLHRTGTTIWGYVVGWGLLVPFWILAPNMLLNTPYVQVPNIVERFTFSVVTPTVCIFRILESLYGFTPILPGDRTNASTPTLGAFCLYVCSSMRLVQRYEQSKEIDPVTQNIVAVTITTTVPVRRSLLLRQLLCFVQYVFGMGAYLSFLQGTSDTFVPKYALGPTSTPSNLYEWSSLWTVRQWKDNLLYAILFQITLSTFAEGIRFATMLLTQCETLPFSDNPLGASTSPSDFWGHRWNRCVQDCLKNGVFKPVRFVGRGPRWLAIAATFIASALFHEWLLPTVFYDYPNTHGTATAFFLWQAILVALEAALGWTVTRGTKSPPRRGSVLQTAGVVALGLPPAHWFMDSYIRSNLFAHTHPLLPMILAVNRTATCTT